MDVREKLVELLNNSFSEQYEKRGLLTAPHTATDLIAHGVTFATDKNVGGKWIPVSERLPENDGWYLVYIPKSGTKVFTIGFAKDGRKVSKYDFEREWKHVWYDHDSEWGYYTVSSVTHWMPLPEPPKGE